MTDQDVAAPEVPPPPGGEGRVTLVGTAHVSQESVDEVERTIADERPDVVAVELDEGRYRQMKGGGPEELEASDLLRGNTVFQFLAYWMLSYLQTKLGDRFDVEPGADMLAAIESAEEADLGVALVDRDIQTTVQRFWARLTLREKLSLVGSLVAEMGAPIVVGPTIVLTLTFVPLIAVEAASGPLVLPAGDWVGPAIPVLGGLGGLVVTVLDFLVVQFALTAVLGIPLAALLSRFREGGEDVAEFDVEDLTDTDVVTAMMEEFRRFSPGGAEALIDERDAFIAHRLVELRSAGYDVVAVVGAGHREGVASYLDSPETLPPMEGLVGRETGGRFSLYKVVGYAITLGFGAFFVLLALGGVDQTWLLKVFAVWFAVNAVCAGGLAKLAGAHWPSAIVGGGVAWLTSVNPLLAPGWFAGYVELRYENVNVGDISRLNEILDDEESPLGDILARMRAVPLFRLIMVVALTNVGSMIASLVVFPAIVPWLAAPIGGSGAVAQALVDGVQNGARIVWSAVA